MVIAVLCLGVVIATVIVFGFSRSRDSSIRVSNLEKSQAAAEALAGAAKRVQSMYANEAGCDPMSLNKRLSAMSNLPSNPSSIGLTFGGRNLVYEYYDLSLKAICNTGTTGCRQMAIPVGNRLWIVTVGAIAADSDSVTSARTGDCPRDVTVTLTTAATGRRSWIQRVTLTNICTLAACDSSVGGRGFDSQGTLTLSGSMSTSACTGTYAGVRSTKYGGGFTESGTTKLSLDDLRWARRYLETGGEGIGETNFLYLSSGSVGTGNGSCPPASSASQCKDKNCFPALDLNRDYKNNESDLGILEHFMRGYLTTLPVNELP
jgi:hypothetical protein